jgi:hypothetical protein
MSDVEEQGKTNTVGANLVFALDNSKRRGTARRAQSMTRPGSGAEGVAFFADPV